MATSSLSLVTRRFVGWLLILSGVFLGLGLLVQLGWAAYQYISLGSMSVGLGTVGIDILGLVAASLLVRYGRRLRRGGHISDGPAEEIIL